MMHRLRTPLPPTIRSLLLLLTLAAPTAGRAEASARYVCALRPGPPAKVRVRTAGPRPRRVGPVLTYRARGKMASAADVDGDGRLDLLVLVHKKTRYDPRPGWRPFVYTLRDGRWVPKWLGSRVGHPLEEAALVRVPEGVRLLTVERFGPGRSGLTLYAWRGFGFRGTWTGPAEPTMRGLRVSAGGTGESISVRVNGRRRVYVCRKGGYQLQQSRGERG